MAASPFPFFSFFTFFGISPFACEIKTHSAQNSTRCGVAHLSTVRTVLYGPNPTGKQGAWPIENGEAQPLWSPELTQAHSPRGTPTRAMPPPLALSSNFHHFRIILNHFFYFLSNLYKIYRHLPTIPNKCMAKGTHILLPFEPVILASMTLYLGALRISSAGLVIEVWGMPVYLTCNR